MPWHSGRESRGSEKALVCPKARHITLPKAGSGLKHVPLQLKAPPSEESVCFFTLVIPRASTEHGSINAKEVFIDQMNT